VFIVDLENVFSVLRAENDRSAVALITGIVRPSINVSMLCA